MGARFGLIFLEKICCRGPDRSSKMRVFDFVVCEEKKNRKAKLSRPCFPLLDLFVPSLASPAAETPWTPLDDSLNPERLAENADGKLVASPCSIS